MPNSIRTSITGTATVEADYVDVKIEAYRNGTKLRLAASTISGNSVTLYNRTEGGPSGFTGIILPFVLTFQPKSNEYTGPTYSVTVIEARPTPNAT